MFAIALDKSVLGGWLEERRRRGLDRRDEVWEGVLHMVPLPAFEHDELVMALGRVFGTIVLKHRLGRIGNTNVREPNTADKNYRGPDLIFIAKSGITKFAPDSHAWIEHGPDFLVEVLSPEDEAPKKLPFYAKREVPEILFVDGETARPQIFRLVRDEYVVLGSDPEGGLKLECLGARLFFEPAPQGWGRLTVKDDRTGETHLVVGPS